MSIGHHQSDSYNKDFYAWAIHNAKLIRKGKFSELDINNIAEELESMGNRDKRQLINRLSVLISHLLKWQFQSEKQSKSWKLTIKEQRLKVHELLSESPSLKHELNEKMLLTYKYALILTTKQTKINEKILPKKCPYSLEQCLNNKFFPE